MRLIDADALIDWYRPYGQIDEPILFETIVSDLRDFPTVDAVPVVNGECYWCKPREELCGTCRKFFDYYGDGGSDRCSASFDDTKCAYYEPISHCPNCGAKMDGGAEGG